MNRTLATALAAVIALAGCSSSSGDRATMNSEPVALLDVHVGLFGGPATRSGGEALTNSPVAHVLITAVDAHGNSTSARTNGAGTARFVLVPGSYTVTPHYCGQAAHRVSIAPARTARVQVSCPVP